MLDALQFLMLIGIFGAVIWFTVIQAPDRKTEILEKDPGAPARKPSLGPVGLYCSVCREFAGVVGHDEYLQRLQAGDRTYCSRCFLTIEEYERQQAQIRAQRS